MSRRAVSKSKVVGSKRLNAAGWLSIAYAVLLGIWAATYWAEAISTWDFQFYTGAEGPLKMATMGLQVLVALAALAAGVADLRRSGSIRAANITWMVLALILGTLLPLDSRLLTSPWLGVFAIIAGAVALGLLALQAEKPRRAALGEAAAEEDQRDELAARRGRRVA